jgi:hypothetical protein
MSEGGYSWQRTWHREDFERRGFQGDVFVLTKKPANQECSVKACFDYSTGGLTLFFGYNGSTRVLSNDTNVLKEWEKMQMKLSPFIKHMRGIKQQLIEALNASSIDYIVLESAVPQKASKHYCDEFYLSMRDLIDIYFRLS